MNVQEWLEQVKKLDQLIDAKIAERERLLALATNGTAKPPDGMPHGGGLPSSKVETITIRLLELADETNQLIDNYVDLKREVCAVLEKLPANEYAVMHRFYIRRMRMYNVANELCYSERRCWQFRKNALKRMESWKDCSPFQS